jgi:hypothetical protein
MTEDFLEFKEKYNQLFIENKELVSFSWSNFIPYDSDDLLSKMNLLSLNGQNHSSISNDMKKVWIEVFKLLKSYNNSFFILNFGTNVMVTINSNGNINVDEYDEYF